MGLEFKVEKIERKILDRVICDRCGKEIEKVTEGGWNQFGEPMSKFHEPSFNDFFLLEHSWGYSSRKDTQTHQAVVCEDCYDEIFKDVKITVTHYM